MPGAEHVVAYHLVAKGQCWASMEGEAPALLNRGDIVMFPRGDAHAISSAPGLRPHHEPGYDEWVLATRNDPKPLPVSYRGDVLQPGVAMPTDEASTVIVCGFIGCDRRPFNPLIEALPRLLHLLRRRRR